MTIKINFPKKEGCILDQLPLGSCFIYEGNIYLLPHTVYNYGTRCTVTNLSNATICTLDKSRRVVPINCEVNVV